MRTHHLLLAAAVTVLSSLTIFPGCGSGDDDSIPAKARLMERIQIYHQALLEEDHATRYSMQPPYLREAVSFEVWKKEFGIADGNEPSDPIQMIDARIAETRSCDNMSSKSRPGLHRCVFVIELTYEDQSGKKVEQLTETWDFLGNEWYFAWLSHH